MPAAKRREDSLKETKPAYSKHYLDSSNQPRRRADTVLLTPQPTYQPATGAGTPAAACVGRLHS